MMLRVRILKNFLEVAFATSFDSREIAVSLHLQPDGPRPS
jgi:hypothetical protein